MLPEVSQGGDGQCWRHKATVNCGSGEETEWDPGTWVQPLRPLV